MRVKPSQRPPLFRVLCLLLALCLLLGVVAAPARALNATPSTANNKANIYIYLDGSWNCLGSADFTVTTGFFQYTPTLTTSALLALINGAVSADHALSASSFKARYADDVGFTSNTGYGSVGDTSTTLGTLWGWDVSETANATKYVRVMATDSSDSAHNPLAFYTVTIQHSDGTVDSLIVPTGASVTLPEGSVWTDGTSSYAGGSTATITNTTTFTVGGVTTCTVTCVNGDVTTTDTVDIGSAYTLPELAEDYRWVSSSDGTAYEGGATVTVQSNVTFTATVVEKETIAVSYTVNFPSGSTGFYGTTFPDSPTLSDTTVTAITDTVVEGETTSARDLSSRVLKTASTTHGGGFHCAILFTGWQTEGGEVIEPSSVLTWDDLKSYDTDGDGDVEMTGQWAYAADTNANFCVRYDSKVGQSDTSTSKYTPSLFTTYVGGDGSYDWNGETDEDAYDVDKDIRALYGNFGGDLYLYSFPTDAYIFEQLKNYTSSLTVNGKTVSADDLDAEHYAIRWYKLKKDASDGWHIDGRLVEKVGQITIDKEFYGNAEAIALAKEGFYIVAQNGTLNDDGSLTAYASTETEYKQYVLVLDEDVGNELASAYPDATILTYSTADGDSYEWLIEDVALEEYWQITEYPVDVEDYIYYTEYSVYDTDGEVTALAEYGTRASVIGKTFFMDENPDQGLLVDFRNYYYPKESIFIKNEDGSTGLPLNGATFELWQKNSDGVYVQLTFSYDDTTGQYTVDPDGDITQITTGDASFTAISTSGFSYAYGDVLVKEVTPPDGYDPALWVTLNEADGGVVITDVTYANGERVDEDVWSRYVALQDGGEVLVIKNYSSATTSVTVNKVWADNVTADSVTVDLLADGTLATSVFPGLAAETAVLNADNGWTYTWSDLPVYANGSQVEWSVKETKIGDDATLADNVSFANWTVVYSPATKTDEDGDGVDENWAFTVTNTVRRAQLFVTATNLVGTVYLEDAEFTLTQVEWSSNTWSAVNGAVSSTETSDANGLTHFDNLTTGAFYQLTQTSAPDGYLIMQESIVITLDGAGQVMEVTSGVADSTTLDSDYHTYTSPYNMAVRNVLQYQCSITAPNSITLTFTGEEKRIWNPENLTYETETDGQWSGGSEPISVTNLSGADVDLDVEVTLTYTDSYADFGNISLQLSSSDTSFAATSGDGYTAVSGALAKDETCSFFLEISGVPSLALTSTPVQIGEVSVRVKSPSSG